MVGSTKILMFSQSQRKLIAEFCTNLAVVWLGAGIITPIVVNKFSVEFLSSGLISAFWAIALFVFGLNTLKGVK